MLHLKKVLFARDFTECSERALPYARTLARCLGADLHVLYVDVPSVDGDVALDNTSPSRTTPADDLHERLLRDVERDGDPSDESGGLHVVPVIDRGLTAAPAILDYARANDIDLIVMGTHGRRGLRHVLLGSVAEEVVRLAPCSVLTVRTTDGAGTDFSSFTSILVPIDFSRYAVDTLDYAKELAARFDARLDLLHVVDIRYRPSYFDTGLFSIYDVEPDAEEKACARLRQLYHASEGHEWPSVRIGAVTGAAAHEIVKAAARNRSSLIVMATHGLTGLSHFLIGSVAEKVVRTAPCPVLTIKSFGKDLFQEQRGAGTAVIG